VDYIPIYNQKFAVQPIFPIDCYESLRLENDLKLIFSQRVTRTLSKDLHFQFEHSVYQIVTDCPAYALQGREVTVCKSTDAHITVLLNNEPLDFKHFLLQLKRKPLYSGKALVWIPQLIIPGAHTAITSMENLFNPQFELCYFAK